MVHFYDEIDDHELFEICVEHRSDLDRLIEAFEVWLEANDHLLDEGL